MQKKLKREEFPNVGDRRFFVVTHNPKSIKTPVRVELREAIVAEKRLVSLSTLLGFDNTVADRDAILKTAALIEARVGNIDAVVGEF